MRAVKMLMYPNTLRVLALYSNKFEGNLSSYWYFFKFAEQLQIWKLLNVSQEKGNECYPSTE